MPIIAVQVIDFARLETNLRLRFTRGGIPEYSYKDHRAGFEVWHARQNEGEVTVIWHTFESEDHEKEQIAGLRRCAELTMQESWVRIDVPSMYTDVNRPTLRVLHRLAWIKSV
jgi:hypothetical protein